MPTTGKRRRQRAALIDWVTDLKKVVCPDCGFDGRGAPVAMDFDHVRGKKRFTISQFVRKSGHLDNARELLEAEIAKTEVCCSNCHRIRTHRRLKRRSVMGG